MALRLLAIIKQHLSLQTMIALFKNKISIYLFSALLFFSFAVKTSVCLGKQWSVVFIDTDDEHPNEEENQGKKDNKSLRMVRKAWYFQWPENHTYFTKEPATWEAHNSVYLLAIISEPLIPIITQPPEFVA